MSRLQRGQTVTLVMVNTSESPLTASGIYFASFSIQVLQNGWLQYFDNTEQHSSEFIHGILFSCQQIDCFCKSLFSPFHNFLINKPPLSFFPNRTAFQTFPKTSIFYQPISNILLVETWLLSFARWVFLESRIS